MHSKRVVTCGLIICSIVVLIFLSFRAYLPNRRKESVFEPVGGSSFAVMNADTSHIAIHLIKDLIRRDASVFPIFGSKNVDIQQNYKNHNYSLTAQRLLKKRVLSSEPNVKLPIENNTPLESHWNSWELRALRRQEIESTPGVKKSMTNFCYSHRDGTYSLQNGIDRNILHVIHVEQVTMDSLSSSSSSSSSLSHSLQCLLDMIEIMQSQMRLTLIIDISSVGHYHINEIEEMLISIDSLCNKKKIMLNVMKLKDVAIGKFMEPDARSILNPHIWFDTISKLSNQEVNTMLLDPSKILSREAIYTVQSFVSLDLLINHLLKNLGTGLYYQNVVQIGRTSTVADMIVAFAQNVKKGYSGKSLQEQQIGVFVEWIRSTYFFKDIIFSNYFTSREDSQRPGVFQTPNNFSMMENWYNSVHGNNLHAFVLHDNLDAEFIGKYSSNNVRFLGVQNLGPRPSNDARFFVIQNIMSSWNTFLCGTIFESWKPEYLLNTDLFDVKFLRDPFIYMREITSRSKNPIFCGSERDSIITNEWLMANFELCGMKDAFLSLELPKWLMMLNAGLLGAPFDVFQLAVDRIVSELSYLKTMRFCDMPVFNYVVYKFFQNQLITGEPFHSPFYSWQSDSSKYFIQHK